MVKVIKCQNYEEVLRVAEVWGRVEDIQELQNPEFSYYFPVYVYLEDNVMYASDTKDDQKCLEVTLEGYDNVKEILNFPQIFRGYSEMNKVFIHDIGRTFHSLYVTKDDVVVTKEGLNFPLGALVDSLSKPPVERGNIVKLKSPFVSLEDLREHFKVQEEQELVVVSTQDNKARVQVRGTKDTITVHFSLLEVTGSIVRFKRPSICFGDVHNFEEEYQKVQDFYKKISTGLSGDFKSILKSSLHTKNDYLGFLFNGGTTTVLGESKEDREVIIKHHPRFKEMLSSLEELGYDTKERMQEILSNSLVVDGKTKRVTGILQTEKKLRFDDVYTYPSVLFPDNLIISISPVEFASASYNVEASGRSGDLRSSCFSPSGSYHAGVWAYFQSKQAAIIKIKNKDNETYYRTWVCFDLDNGGIVIGRQYGSISDTQIRVLRYMLEKRVADFLGLPNSWRVTSDIRIDWEYDSDSTYLDSPRYVMINKSVSPDTLSICLPTGITSSGDCSDNGEFDATGHCCDDCGDVGFDDDDLTTVFNGDRVCDRCLEEYRFCERRDEYYPADDCIYIADQSIWVHQTYSSDYIEINGEYYESIPEGYVELENGEIVEIDEAFCCYFDNCWYSSDESVQILIKGNTEYAHKDNVPKTYKECRSCGVFIPIASKSCKECGEIWDNGSSVEELEEHKVA